MWKQETFNRIKKNKNIILKEEIFKKNFYNAILEANKLVDFEVNDTAFGVIVEMCFYLGIKKVSKYFKLFGALKIHNYEKAANEILLIDWFKEEPELCEELSNIIKKL